MSTLACTLKNYLVVTKGMNKRFGSTYLVAYDVLMAFCPISFIILISAYYIDIFFLLKGSSSTFI